MRGPIRPKTLAKNFAPKIFCFAHDLIAKPSARWRILRLAVAAWMAGAWQAFCLAKQASIRYTA
jgi:hypothetical protein